MINGKRYSTKLKHNSDFLDFIQQVVEQTILDGRFYPLYEGDYNDVSGYIFLSTEQRHVLESEGLLSSNRYI